MLKISPTILIITFISPIRDKHCKVILCGSLTKSSLLKKEIIESLKEKLNIEILELIAASLANEISIENKKKLDLWISESPLNNNVYNDYVNTWELFNKTEITSEINIDDEWEIFKKSAKINEGKIVKFKFASLLKYAASIIIIATISITVYFILNNNKYI